MNIVNAHFPLRRSNGKWKRRAGNATNYAEVKLSDLPQKRALAEADERTEMNTPAWQILSPKASVSKAVSGEI